MMIELPLCIVAVDRDGAVCPSSAFRAVKLNSEKRSIGTEVQIGVLMTIGRRAG